MKALFWGLLALHLAMVWAYPFFPTQDGPTHLANASILRLYEDPGFPSVRRVHELNPEALPNWLVFAALSRLMDFAPPRLAEKLLLSVYLIGMPLALRRLLRELRGPAAEPYALLAFPLTANAFLFLGFYNFVLSLPLHCLLLAGWLRWRERWTAARWLLFTAGATLLYFCHLVTWVVAALSLAVLAFAQRERLVQRLAPSALAFLPGALLALAFLSSRAEAPMRWLPLPWLLRSFLRAQSIAAFSYAELPGSMGLLALLASLAWKARGDAFRALAIALVLLHFLGPDEIAHRDTIAWRVGWFALLSMLLAASARPAPRWLTLASLLITLSLWAVRMERIGALNEALAEYVSVGAALPDDATLLPLSFSHHGTTPDGAWMSRWVHPFRHAGGYLAAGRRVVDLGNYAADTGAFPVLYREGQNPRRWMGELEAQPPCVQFEGGPPPDFLLLWQFDQAPWHPCLAGFTARLDRAYELVQTSRPHAWARLYRLKRS